MPAGRRDLVVSIGAVIAALIVANVLGDAFALASFALTVARAAAGIAAAAMLGAVSGALFGGPRGQALRTAAAAGIACATVAFVLLRFPAPWIDLGPFGAGPATAVAVLLLPATQIAGIGAARLVLR